MSRFKPRVLGIATVIILLLLPVIWPASLQIAEGEDQLKSGQATTFDPAKDTFSFDNRLSIFIAIDSIVNVLWNSKTDKTLRKEPTGTFSALPILLLTDRNGDNKAEEFAYVAREDKKDTPEFGFFFDLNKDGKADYLVYNGGPLFKKDFTQMFWMNYHAIDSNGDGKVDIFVFNTVHLQGEEMYDEGTSGWIYDRDFDGVFDSAEYLGKDFQQAIPVSDSAFTIKSAVGERSWKVDTDMGFWNGILKEISEVSGE
jgi:hypothetical protein